MELGLSRKDVNLLMSSVDVDHDGLVSYAEFVPMCFSILVDRFTDQILSNAMLHSDDLLAKDLIARFAACDAHGSGQLSPHRVKLVRRNQRSAVSPVLLHWRRTLGAQLKLTLLWAQCLDSFSFEVFAMSQYQIHAMMTVAPLRASEMVDYERFAPIAAATVRKMMDANYMRRRYLAIQSLSETEEFQARVGRRWEVGVCGDAPCRSACTGSDVHLCRI